MYKKSKINYCMYKKSVNLIFVCTEIRIIIVCTEIRKGYLLYVQKIKMGIYCMYKKSNWDRKSPEIARLGPFSLKTLYFTKTLYKESIKL